MSSDLQKIDAVINHESLFRKRNVKIFLLKSIFTTLLNSLQFSSNLPENLDTCFMTTLKIKITLET